MNLFNIPVKFENKNMQEIKLAQKIFAIVVFREVNTIQRIVSQTGICGKIMAGHVTVNI